MHRRTRSRSRPERQGGGHHRPRHERRDRLRAGAARARSSLEGSAHLRCRRSDRQAHHPDPGGPELIATMKSKGCYTALVSGGFTVFTSRIGATLGFDENRANTLLEENGMLTGFVAEPILGKQAKVDALEDIAEKLGISPDDAIAVGDGANDLGMLHLAGSGVALHAKPAVAAEAKIEINHGDLTALLYIQGYRKTDFVAA
ncbi:HAD family phosphatase [Rhizobium sp. BG6]|uniref:HAD-IB family phosphatase n=1 Tax=Rhizobium sp. BG6 TaxID=2613771 RepID=UPI001FF03EBE|nr:HAD family phosphatase [Rhizobium sp. BG6]